MESETSYNTNATMFGYMDIIFAIGFKQKMKDVKENILEDQQDKGDKYCLMQKYRNIKKFWTIRQR